MIFKKKNLTIQKIIFLQTPKIVFSFDNIYFKIIKQRKNYAANPTIAPKGPANIAPIPPLMILAKTTAPTAAPPT